MKIKSLVLFLSLVLFGACTQKQSFMNDNNTPKGVAQARALWTEADGSQDEFEQLVADYLCQTDSERFALYESLRRLRYGIRKTVHKRILTSLYMIIIARQTAND